MKHDFSNTISCSGMPFVGIEVLEFDATEDAPSTMDIEVFDFEGPFSEAESLGYAEINFLKQSSEDLADLWVQLEGKYAQLQGSKVHLRICLINTKDSDHVNHYIQKVEKEAGKKVSTGRLFLPLHLCLLLSGLQVQNRRAFMLNSGCSKL